MKRKIVNYKDLFKLTGKKAIVLGGFGLIGYELRFIENVLL